MLDIIYLVIGLFVGGLVIGLFLKSKMGKYEAKADLLENGLTKNEQELTEEREKATNFQSEISKLETVNQNLQEKLENQKKEVEELQEKFSDAFKNLANEIFDEKTKKFTEQNRSNLDEILNPLKEKIKEFEKKVEQTYDKELRDRISLKEEIKKLSEKSQLLSDEANNLASALKGESKTRGDWGETRLELILEKAGLEKDIHYVTQEIHRNQEGIIKKPDFIINLPDNKHLIIDSKVSLIAYEAYFNSKTKERNIYLKNHVTSIRNHIKDLNSKNYHELYDINTPDYVLMYVPIENAFTLALQNDKNLFFDALDKNIVIVTTSTLLATMKTVSLVWQQENQKKNVLEIARQSGALYDKFLNLSYKARQSGALYDKFKNFVDDLQDVGSKLNLTKKSYEQAMNKLSEGRGNLIRRAENIKKLGAKTSKSLPTELLESSENDVKLIE